MVGSGRVVGIGLMIGSLVLLLAFGGWLATVLSSQETTGSGAMLGGLLIVQQEKKILNMVLAQGQVSMSELVAELQQPREVVEDMIRSLVGKQLFSGAINWEKGIFYSVESQTLTEDRRRVPLLWERGLSDKEGCCWNMKIDIRKQEVL